MSKTHSEFRFHKNDTIGAPAAEDDAEYLASCFVETGDLRLLTDPEDRRIILLGRTGAGKTALLRRLDASDINRVIQVSPENLALTYIANSSVLNFFTELGINLDPFYKLLWRHVFTVEVLTRFFEQQSSLEPVSLFDRIRNLFTGTSRGDKELRQAIDYLEEWGSQFWNETEYRVKEITQKVEKDLKRTIDATLGVDWLSASIGQNTASKLSEEQKIEVIHRAQEVVAATQVKDLHQVSSLLAKVLNDKQKNYFIIIDRLDDNWVEERLRYKLIMGLILTAREFISIPRVKIIIALRRDLIDRVFRLSRDSGFQEEKYRGLYLPLTWTKAHILEILERRVGRMVSRRYTKQPASYNDLLPCQYKGQPIGEFIFSVANRPRDVVALFNICIHAAVDKSRLTAQDLAKAMGEYSQSRLRALADEWYADYPFLLDFAAILRGRPTSFKIDTVKQNAMQDLCLDIVVRASEARGVLIEVARAVVEDLVSPLDFRSTMFHVFYRTGLVGLKVSPETAASWVDDTGHAVTPAEITGSTTVNVAPKYVHAVGSRIS